MGEYYVNGQLFHHGVKGQKWGVRRYRRKDGTLTPAGKRRYGRMSDEQLQKTLWKQVKDAREEQGDFSSRYNIHNTIGKNSKEEWERYNSDRGAHLMSKEYTKARKEWHELDSRYNRGEIDEDEYHALDQKISKTIYRPELDNSVRYTNNGRQYTQAYLDKYGKDLNVAYLKDLGYDEATAKEFTERIMKTNRKMLNGL